MSPRRWIRKKGVLVAVLAFLAFDLLYWLWQTMPIATTFQHSGEGMVRCISLSSDGGLLASARGYWVGPGRKKDKPCEIKVWDVRTKEALHTFDHGEVGDIDSVAFSADNALLASGGPAQTVLVWELGTGENVARLQLGERAGIVTGLAFSEESLAAGASFVRVWETGTWEERFTLRGHRGWVHSVSFSPDGAFPMRAGFQAPSHFEVN